jgi:hypothetical protein
MICKFSLLSLQQFIPDIKSQILLQQLITSLICEGVVVISECPPHDWDGKPVQQWRERMQKVNELSSLVALCSLGHLNHSVSPNEAGQLNSQDDALSQLIDYCASRTEELELEEEEDIDDYIIHDLGKFQLHQLGMENYRRYACARFLLISLLRVCFRFVILVGEGRDKDMANCKNGVCLTS